MLNVRSLARFSGPPPDGAVTDGEDRLRREAIDSYFRNHVPALLRLLRRQVRDPEQALDLVQTAFERLTARFARPQDLAHPRALLLQIARNALVDLVRREKIRRDCDGGAIDEDPITTCDHRSPEFILLQRERLSQLSQIITALPPKRRRIFILSRLHHLTLAEIAAQEHMSKRAVRGHVERALTEIRAAMADDPEGHG